MRKPPPEHRALMRSWVALLLAVSFFYVSSTMATTEVSGNEVNTDGKLVNLELAKPSPEVHDEVATSKGFFHPKRIYKKPFFIKSFLTVKPERMPVSAYKSIPKPVSTVKPIPKPIIEEKVEIPWRPPNRRHPPPPPFV